MATNNYLITSVVPLLKMFLDIGINNLYLTPSDLGFSQIIMVRIYCT